MLFSNQRKWKPDKKAFGLSSSDNTIRSGLLMPTLLYRAYSLFSGLCSVVCLVKAFVFPQEYEQMLLARESLHEEHLKQETEALTISIREQVEYHVS